MIALGGANGSSTFGGQINDGPSGGKMSLEKDGSGTLTLTGRNTYSSDTTINSGTLTIGGTGVLGNGSYDGSIVNYGVLQYSSSATQTLNGAINDYGAGGTLIKDGPGYLILTGSNDYYGSTTVSGGTLAVNGWILNSSDLTVGSGGTLAGTGTISTSVTINGGGLRPGNGPNDIGKLTVDNLTLANNPRLYFDLSATNLTDTVIVNGDLILTGMTTNWFVFSATNTLTAGAYTLFHIGGSVVDLGGNTNFTNIAGQPNATGYLWLDQGNNNLDLLIVIPEPGTGALVVGGLALMFLLRRRRR